MPTYEQATENVPGSSQHQSNDSQPIQHNNWFRKNYRRITENNKRLNSRNTPIKARTYDKKTMTQILSIAQWNANGVLNYTPEIDILLISDTHF